MTQFEQNLLYRGYKKFVLDCRKMKFEVPQRHTLSTMVNIDHRYFHETDTVILQKIEAGVSVKDIPYEDRKGEICFGLHEQGKPATLISPRPRIQVKRPGGVLEHETKDDSMIIALQKFSFEEVFEAMYDQTKILVIDLTKEQPPQ
jgi:hypothetical protein